MCIRSPPKPHVTIFDPELLNDLNWRGCYFPSGPDGHLAASYDISRLGPRAVASNCVRRHGGYTSWRGSENSRRGLSPFWLGRVRLWLWLWVLLELG